MTQASYFSFLSLSLLICSMGIVIIYDENSMKSDVTLRRLTW